MTSARQRSVGDAFRTEAASLRRLVRGVLRDDGLADEALQRTCVQLIEHLDQVEPERLTAWLHRTAFHQALEVRRGEVRRSSAHERWAREAVETWAEDTAQLAEERELQARLRDEVQRLPLEQRSVLELRMRRGQTFEEIARSLGLPLGTVSTRMRTALQRLRQRLEERE